MADFLVWLPSRRPAQLKIPDQATLVARSQQPLGHFTGQRHLLRRVSPGDRLWLFRAGLHGLKTPALDGLIVVAAIEDTAKGVWMGSGPGSRWFGWNDALGLIGRLRFAGNAKSASVALDRPLGPQLQTVRQITESAELDAYAKAVATRPTLFVSYRWTDGGKLISSVVVAAAEAGFAPWVDRWSAPRRFTEGIEDAPDESPSALLVSAIAGCSAAVLIETESYGVSRWTAAERATIVDGSMPRLSLTPATCLHHETLVASLREFRELVMHTKVRSFNG